MSTNESVTPFPFRTIVVCFTIWLTVTEILVFDQLKFDAKAELLNQAAQALHGSQLTVPSEPQSNLPAGTGMEKL